MTVYRLEPAGPGVSASLPETVDRIASIVRKYATTRVATREHAIDVDLDAGTFHCDEPEAARRLATIAASWTGTRVEARPVVSMPADSAPEPVDRDPWTVHLPVRGDGPAMLRERVTRAATRLEAMLDMHGSAPARWLLHLDRGGQQAAMPLRADAFHGDAEALERWLPDQALEGVTGIRIELRARRVMEPAGGREAVPARPGAA